MNTEIVLFDPVGRSESGLLHLWHGPAEFPIATVRPREARAQVIALVGSLQRWLVARWQWFRPRTVPCAVAALGMVAVLASAHYLANHKDDNCLKRHIVQVDLAPR